MTPLNRRRLAAFRSSKRGMGSLAGAFVASLLIGCMQTFAVSLDWSLGGISIAQAAPVLKALGKLSH